MKSASYFFVTSRSTVSLINIALFRVFLTHLSHFAFSAFCLLCLLNRLRIKIARWNEWSDKYNCNLIVTFPAYISRFYKKNLN